jgi:3-oxoacid CoA-transferase subunit B
MTDLAVIDVKPGGLQLCEVAPGGSVDNVRSATEPGLAVSDHLSTVKVGQ